MKQIWAMFIVGPPITYDYTWWDFNGELVNRLTANVTSPAHWEAITASKVLFTFWATKLSPYGVILRSVEDGKTVSEETRALEPKPWPYGGEYIQFEYSWNSGLPLPLILGVGAAALVIGATIFKRKRR